MLELMEVLGCMFVLGRIATAHMPTGEAQTQVNPCIAHLQAFFAALSAGRDFANFA
jgi:hypothetical protein